MRGLVLPFRSRRPRPFLERQHRFEKAWSRPFIIVEPVRSFLDDSGDGDREAHYKMREVWPLRGFPWFEYEGDQPERTSSQD